MMRKYIAGGSAVLLLILAISCGSSKHSKSADALPGTWQAQPIAIDGDSKDWPSPYPNYDSKAMVGYATSNDKYYLYITMESGDEMTEMKILKQGMTVSIDTSGEKEPGFNINYPLPNDNDPLEMTKHSAFGEGNKLHPEGRWEPIINKSAKEANQYTLDGFIKCNGGYMVSQTTACGIKVILKIDEYKELVWEAAIPFKAIYGKDSINEKDAGKPISVCFAVNRFKHPETKAENNAGSTNNSMGGGSMRGGGARGGGGRSGGGKGGGRNPSSDPLEHLYESTKTWKHFALAYQK